MATYKCGHADNDFRRAPHAGGCPLCEIERLRAVNAQLLFELTIEHRALQSIAANTCCSVCQEAALVARAAIEEATEP